MYKIFLLLIYGICFASLAQNQSKSLDLNCGLYLYPLVDFKLNLGNSKDSVLKNFELIKKKEDIVTNSFPEKEFFLVEKNITLPNGITTKCIWNLNFKNTVLEQYSLYFNIGKDYKYFWEVINFIESQDIANNNHFSDYIRKNNSLQYFSTTCNKIIKVTRSRKKDFFDFKVRVY